VETEYIVIKRAAGCECDIVAFGPKMALTFMHEPNGYGYGEQGSDPQPCPHGSTVLAATAADIPADLAARSLGLNAEVLVAAQRHMTAWGYGSVAFVLSEAARRIREAQAADDGPGAEAGEGGPDVY